MKVVLPVVITCGLVMAMLPPGKCGPSLFGLPKPSDITPVTLQDFKALTDQLKGLNTLTSRLEQSLAAEKDARKSLQNFFETAKEKLSELENAVTPDKGNYWAESTNCGGILISQTGRIKFDVISDNEKVEKCVWTVRTNLRSKIRVKYIEQWDQVKSSMYVTEIRDLDTNKLSTTRLNTTSMMFEGPLIVITFVAFDHYHQYSIFIEFEGVGKNINKDVSYQHYHFNEISSSLSRKNVSLTNPKKSKTISTFVINPVFKDTADLHVKLDGGVDCSKTSLALHENFIQTTSPGVRCCQNAGQCEKSEFVNSDGIFLITETGETKAQSNFEFNWVLDSNVPNATSENTCGGILKGRKGYIEYKFNETYASNERCVWVIQPTGRAGARFRVVDMGLEPEYDALTLTPLSLTVSDEEPSTLRFTSEDKTHLVNGNIILVTFYSDILTEGTGFTLFWEDAGKDLSDEDMKIEVITNTADEGSYKTDGKLSGTAVIVVNPHYSDGSGLNLKLNKLQADIQASSNNGVTVYGNSLGNYTVTQKYRETPAGGFHPEEFENSHGIFVILFINKNDGAATATNEIDLSWKKGLNANEVEQETYSPVEVNQSEGCGGILKGDKGTIKYKATSEYENNERCTWVIETSGKSKLSLKLLEDGFESCCDMLLAVALDPTTGSLLTNEAQKITRENKIASFSSSVVFVTFFSDSSAVGNGFNVEFVTGGKHVESPVKYRHHLISDPSGSVSYPSENEIAPGNNEILSFLWSPNPVSNDTLITEFHISTTGFGTDSNCNEDSLKIYGAPVYTGSTPAEVYSCSKEDQSCQCTEELTANANLTQTNRGFIGIFRPVASPNANKHLQIDWSMNKDESQPEEVSPE